MSDINPRDIFPFLDLPREVRDMIYGFATGKRPRAIIKPNATDDAMRLDFFHAWYPHLLLINKQFSDEYFDEVCTNELLCYVKLGNFAPSTPEQEVNPASAMKALSKARYLVGESPACNADDLVPFSTPLSGSTISLVKIMPKLKAYGEHLKVRKGDFTLLRGIHEQNNTADKQRKFQDMLAAHGITREIAYKPLAFVADVLCSDPVTKRASDLSGGAIVVFVAKPCTDANKEQHYLFHGLELEFASVKVKERSKPIEGAVSG
ncbi:hypothetical protein PRZ48_009856 [Zasmidium cellare]|uniref:Uncharacterized protein n=1 Tax=Zasmidium cellare TaxID=395010 RepID=A0ABR0EE48_ZASCE|nr:hypothetical protein PRZ48_009856 [Zasmidium cellare]